MISIVFIADNKMHVPRVHNIHHSVWLDNGYAIDAKYVIKDIDQGKLREEVKKLRSLLSEHYSEPVMLAIKWSFPQVGPSSLARPPPSIYTSYKSVKFRRCGQDTWPALW